TRSKNERNWKFNAIPSGRGETSYEENSCIGRGNRTQEFFVQEDTSTDFVLTCSVEYWITICLDQ
ncbi:hypothetical protein BDFB_011082, partial [Asbolus verrucosus]